MAMALRARLQRVARGARHVAQEVSEVAHHADGLRQAEEASMKVHQARPVKPLSFESKALVFHSDVDVLSAALSARRQCRLGALLSVCGFYSFLGSLSLHGALSWELLLAACGGLLANAYVKLAMSQKLIGKLAERHVERLEVATEGAEATAEPMDAAQRLVLDSASVEERLRATKELQVTLTTARGEHRFSLVDGFSDESRQYQLDDAIPEAAEKASVGEMCKLGLIDIDEVAGKCHNAALISALKTSPKVLVDEEVEQRYTEGILAGPPPMLLSEVTKGEVARAERLTPDATAVQEIEAAGWRAQWSGAALMGVGLLFTVGENARDSDGVAKWNRLRWPGREAKE